MIHCFCLTQDEIERIIIDHLISDHDDIDDAKYEIDFHITPESDNKFQYITANVEIED